MDGFDLEVCMRGKGIIDSGAEEYNAVECPTSV